MKVVISLELDYIVDKDILFFLSHEKLITKSIKSMIIKKDKTDKLNDNDFKDIMNKGFNTDDEIQEAIDEDNKQDKSNNNDIYIS